MVRSEREKILTALRQSECDALIAPDIDRTARDTRTLEDLIDHQTSGPGRQVPISITSCRYPARVAQTHNRPE